MVRKIILLAVIAGVAWYFFRDPIQAYVAQQFKPDIYRWKDARGELHYSSDKADAPRGAKQADLPGISVLPSDRSELAKQAARLKAEEQSQQAGATEKPKLPQVRNLAIERIEQAAEKLRK